MEKLSLSDVERIIDLMASVALASEHEFSRLDGVCGDGDFGTSLAAGFKAIRGRWAELDRSSLTAFLKNCGLLITSNVGGCSGPLWGTAFIRSAICVKDKSDITLEDVVAMSEAAQAGMMARGGARLGDKTMLDAIHAATEAVRGAAKNGSTIAQALRMAAGAAEEATETARPWTARRGRQSFTGDRSQNTYDPGMVAVTCMLQNLAEHFSPAASTTHPTPLLP